MCIYSVFKAGKVQTVKQFAASRKTSLTWPKSENID